MSYIAFLDLVGTKATALTDNEAYKKNMELFSERISEIGDKFNLSIYAYSDNAYIGLVWICIRGQNVVSYALAG